jgi:hypothetical protein
MKWEDDGTFVLTTHAELDAIETGLKEEHVFSILEDDLVCARSMSVPMADDVTRIFRKSLPEFRFCPENIKDAKKALENTLALKGLKGWVAKRTGKKQKARFILEALAMTEELFA